MDIFLFDMDGVLLKPGGYHRALQETVQLAGRSIGFDAVWLSDDQIAQFEALGISSEWHSSALCMAVMILEKQKSGAPVEDNSTLISYDLDLEELFDTISAQPIVITALQRALEAIKNLAAKVGIAPNLVSGMVKNSESIANSLTMNWFQELVLGSEVYESTYQKDAQLHTESYLRLYDEIIVSEDNTAKILQWAGKPDHGAAIMTNRPSSTLLGNSGTPEAEMGAELVGLGDLPLVGFGEITWLAEQTGLDAGALNKPSGYHALASILAASAWSLKESLKYVGKLSSGWKSDDFYHLQGSTITVFEDTPGGIVSVQEAGDLLDEMGIRLQIQKIGLAADEHKQSALAAHGAAVYPTVNHALKSLNHF